jgi:hypothetical protein
MRRLRGRAFRPVRQLLLPFFTLHQRKRGADVTDVSERLRKIAQCLPSVSVDLFTVKTQIIAVLGERLDQITGLFGGTTSEREILGLPEAADRESAFRGQIFRAVEQPFRCTQAFAQFAVSGAHPVPIGLFKTVPRK